MGEPPRKYQRLVKFRARLPQISQSALEAVCADIEANGLPECYSRDDQRKARSSVVGQITQHGPVLDVLPLHGDKPGWLHVLNIWAFMDLAWRERGDG